FTLNGNQQLFDLKNDPHELSNIEDPELIGTWRNHMVEFLSVRGAPWIEDGELAVLDKPILRGPNFPA
ncbi:MAG: hypothetical protein KAS23_14880, partial [Anaerohalosphaera sp.]|nr:hypothetical protein [Anaerohalosphaera sp.]